MDNDDGFAADLGGVASRPRVHAQYRWICHRCGGAIMVQEAALGTELLVLDYNETWVHADCL